jgi:hypothetical protein
MSSGDSGGGILDESFSGWGSGGGGNFFDNLLNTYIATQTSGMVTFKDGGFKADAKKDYGLNIYKEISGAKAAEEANEMAREQFETQQANAIKSRNEAQWRAGRDDITRSNLAGRSRSAIGQNGNGGALNLGSDEKDFLGL